MKHRFLIYLLLIGILIPITLISQPAQNYTPENGAIVGKNRGRYNNRPLYINNTNAFVLAGDQPIARLVKDQYLFGTFMIAVERGGKAKWLKQCGQISSFYRPGRMRWTISDKDYSGLSINLDIVPMAATTGMAIRVSAEGVQKGDRLIWTYGGAQWRKGQNLSWKLDVMGQPELLTWGFVPEESKNNQVEFSGQNGLVSLMDSTTHNTLFTTTSNCSSVTKTDAGDASAWSNPLAFTSSKPNQYPILKGNVSLEAGKPIFWSFEAHDKTGNTTLKLSDNSENSFNEGVKRTESFQNRLKINTPDPYLNAVAAASVAAVDGTWYPPVFVHGALQWNMRFPGWRTLFGGTMYGWHNRVRDEAKFYTGFQIKESGKKEAKADPATLLTEQHADSRFYGVGRINKDQNFYDMQTQFFDQIVEEYRWTSDPELVKFFREALELHLIWIRDCFDPDGDGVYESYINVWPTDSQWYNGGGSAEETSYAYRGHLAARDMARNAGDVKAENYHNQMLVRIKKGFFEKLWITEKGHSGSYREQGGHGRLHDDPWLYSIFLPVDAGLTSPLQSIESVYYSEWALQNDRIPGGGRQVWTSNWVPAMWSVRELWPGDNYHLALSYFQAGLPDDGYDIMRGTFLRTAYNHLSPGNLGGVQGGIDFGDCVHTFARTLVSGLFGYHPDYPNGKVTISPQFPSDWNNASIELPDVKIAFKRQGDKINYTFELTHAANLELHLPVQCESLKAVTFNGKTVTWKLLPGVGCSILNIQLPRCEKGDIAIETAQPLPYYPPVTVEGNIGAEIQLKAKGGSIVKFEDPQSVLNHTKIENGVLKANLKNNKGFHTVFAEVMNGKAPQLRVFRIRVNDPEGDIRKEERFVNKIPVKARWENVDIRQQLNADIRTIYQQQYLSPRPNTVSVRLGSDGYSPWTFPHWKSKPPVIALNQVGNFLNDKNQMITSQKVPFAWNGELKNIAFTSMWDNFPRKIDFQVNKTGDGIYFLVCGSTNVMQCHIANAVIRLNYADGKTDSLELAPPVNYWNLCPIDSHATAPGQGSRADYDSQIDRFCMPAKLPETVQLGENCRAMLLNLKMRNGIELKSITLETLSQEVVVGLMGISVMNSK
jgi:hypothetical protein